LSPLCDTDDFTTDEIVSIEADGRAEVFDIQVDRTENFIANAIVTHNTRWHDDDLSGWLLREMKDNDGENWRVISYPAIATHDEKHRKEGEALHPERYNTDALSRIRKAIGERDWWALYQQQPVADEGAYFTRDMFQFYNPEELDSIRGEMNFFVAWDLAIGQTQANDFSVGLATGVDREENLWIVDNIRGRWDSAELVERIIDLHVKWKAEITGLEHGQIHMTLRPFLDRRVTERREWTMRYEPLKTGKRDKVARGRSIQGMARLGKVRLPHPATTPWVNDFINECLRFPSGVNDDQVDALSWLGLMITEMYATLPPAAVKTPSWKDKLDQFAIGGGRHKSAMSA
jgi:predicted phage terminase large subunit-like protein